MEHMEVQFDLVEKNGGACVTKILSPGAACVIPETLSGLPVRKPLPRPGWRRCSFQGL